VEGLYDTCNVNSNKVGWYNVIYVFR